MDTLRNRRKTRKYDKKSTVVKDQPIRKETTVHPKYVKQWGYAHLNGPIRFVLNVLDDSLTDDRLMNSSVVKSGNKIAARQWLTQIPANRNRFFKFEDWAWSPTGLEQVTGVKVVKPY